MLFWCSASLGLKLWILNDNFIKKLVYSVLNVFVQFWIIFK